MAASHGRCYYSKCCKIGEYLAEVNSTHGCRENKLRRSYVLTNEFDFLTGNSDGVCVDADEDFFAYKVFGGRIVGKEPVNEEVFPKCCPMNYTYNTVLHACEESESDFDYIEERFVKVGLPKCKVIVDYELNEATDKYRQLKRSHSSGSYCIDRNEKGSFVYRECKEDIEVCEDIRCIKKCCPDGQSFINRSQCFDTYVHGLNLSTFSNVDRTEGMFTYINAYFILEILN